MRSKNILSIVAFVTAFGLSAAFASLFIAKPTYTSNYSLGSTSEYTPKKYCNLRRTSPTAGAISTLIANDRANGRARGSKMYDIGESYPPSYDSVAFADYAEAVEDYVNTSSSMTTGNLPRDFKSAWREHLKAWRDYSKFLNKSTEISGRSTLTEEDFDEAKRIYDGEISRTYAKVLDVSENYGANVR